MRAAITLLAAVAAAALQAAPPVAPAKVTVAVGELSRIEVAHDAGTPVGWRSGTPDKNLFVDELKGSAGKVRLLVQGKVPGTYLIVLWTAGETDSAVVEVEVTGTPPTPPKPVDPPTPDTPAPIPEKGFRVLIVYETSELAKLPASQTAALTSAELRAYLNDKCVAGADGETKEWRILDKDADLSNESKVWQAAMKRDRKSIPWIVISDGSKGYEGPLPANTADTLKLLKQYGG